MGKNAKFKMIEISKNPIVIYKNGDGDLFDAIYINSLGVVTGRIVKINGKKEFIESGWIPKNSIKQIIKMNRRKVFKKKVSGNKR